MKAVIAFFGTGRLLYVIYCRPGSFSTLVGSLSPYLLAEGTLLENLTHHAALQLYCDLYSMKVQLVGLWLLFVAFPLRLTATVHGRPACLPPFTARITHKRRDSRSRNLPNLPYKAKAIQYTTPANIPEQSVHVPIRPVHVSVHVLPLLMVGYAYPTYSRTRQL